MSGVAVIVKINYPIYLIPHGGGYMSMIDPNDPEVHNLVICTTPELATHLISKFEILSRPVSLANARELTWLLQSLKTPVSQVAVDPRPQGDQMNAEHVYRVQDLLDNLKPDLSPWNYPIFAVAQGDGFLCIESTTDKGELFRAIGVFTSQDLANEYLNEASETGVACPLDNVADTRIFFGALDESITAVALDPVAKGQMRMAKYCFAIDTLLDKYLIVEP